jgi:cobalamin biosynthesis Mg chelatase CobN
MSDKNGAPPKPSVDELRAEIKQTRSELGETVQALAAKADVKARAKDQVEQTKQRVKAQASGAADKVRDAAAAATGRVRTVTAQAAEKVSDTDPRELASTAQERVRQSPVPVSLVFAGVVALVGVILIVRGRRR